MMGLTRRVALSFMFLGEMCVGVVEGAKFLFIFVKVSAAWAGAAGDL